MFAISDEEIRVAVGPFEGEEPVHEHHGGAEETEKSDPVAGNDDGIWQRVGDLVRRLVASDAVFPPLLLGADRTSGREKGAGMVIMQVVGHGTAKGVRRRQDEHRACVLKRVLQ